MIIQSHVQIGKNGVTDNFVKTLHDHFRKHSSVKVSVLKSAGHERAKITEYSKEILEKLGRKYTARVLGFTIFLKKWRRDVR